MTRASGLRLAPRACHRAGLQCRHDTNTCSVSLQRLRARVAEVARPLPAVRGVGLARGRPSAAGSGAGRSQPTRHRSPFRWPTSIRSARPAGATNVPELDRVLGGGLVAGSVTLVGGEPGMGKSTLVLQALGAMAADGARCLLVCAEESAAQVRLRADRLGTLAPDLLVVCETSLPDVCAHAEAMRPDVIAIDSIQAVQDPDAPGGPGSVEPGPRRCAARAAARQGSRHRDAARRSRHQGRFARRPAHARARRRHRALVRGRSPPRAAHAARAEAPLRPHRRARAHGDDRRRARAGLRSERVVPRRSPGRRVGIGGRGRARRHASVVRRGAGAGRADTPAPMPRRVAQSFDGGRLAMLVAIVQQRAERRARRPRHLCECGGRSEGVGAGRRPRGRAGDRERAPTARRSRPTPS